MRIVQQHAQALPVAWRDEFRQRIAARLRGQPSDAAVAAAVNCALDCLHAYSNGTGNN